MESRPLKRYSRPGYPTRLQVLARPQLLRRHLPSAWRESAGMAGAVALLLATNGCTRNAPDTPPTVDGKTVEEVVHGATEPPVPTKAAWVAPIFEHGEGRGSAGCVAVAPPVFLSEEEALQTIIEQFKQSGVDITKTNTIMPELAVEQDFKWVREFRKESSPTGGTGTVRILRGELRGTVKPLEVDGKTGGGKIAFEFVSQSDYYSFGAGPPMSTARQYDFKSVAEAFAGRVAETNTVIYFGTFYDPLTSPFDMPIRESLRGQAVHQQRIEDARELSKSLLRQQVLDFVNWLQAQGAI